MRYLGRLCGAFDILPSSFTLQPTFIERDSAPFALGGYSEVYRATFHDRPVVIKTLKVNPQLEREHLHRVSSFNPKTSTRSLTLHPQLLVPEVIVWKWLRHENILPFIGVTPVPPSISIVSERMENGNIMEFIRANQDYNRLRLVSEGRIISLCRTDRLGSL